MIVYGSTLSPYVRKVMAFAAEKGLAPELKRGGMGQGGPEFAAASPFGKMPGFSDGDFSICDSSAIVTYLEAKYPEPNLIPVAAEARARTIWYDEFADTIVMAAGAPIFGNRFVLPRVLKRDGDFAAVAAAEAQLPPILDYLEGVIPDSLFLVEDRLTLADISVACPFANLHYVGTDTGRERWPRVHVYLDAILSRPSLAAIVEQDKAMIAAMGGAVAA